MRVLVVSGIWPPDVGGPASHLPEFADYLVRRGHAVEAVITADSRPAAESYPVHWVSRGLPAGVRHVATAGAIARHARAADVVYGMSIVGRLALGAAAARRPLVLKLVADDAYERARRWGLFSGSLDDFQSYPGDARLRWLRRARNLALRRVSRLVCPSAYLAELAAAWGLSRERIVVLPNPAPALPQLPSREEARAALGVDGPMLAFAGRITRQKALEVALAALARTDDVGFVIAGDGPDVTRVRATATALGLEQRVRFLGACDRRSVLELFRAADASLLSSAWENFPHTVVEALAVGTPVIATAAGGVKEVVTDGKNGLLVAVGDEDALAAAVGRFFADPALAAQLAARSAASVEHLSTERVYAQLESVLAEVAR